LLREKKNFEYEIQKTKGDYNEGFLKCLKLMMVRHNTLCISQHELSSATSIKAPSQIIKATEPGPSAAQLLPKVINKRKAVC